MAKKPQINAGKFRNSYGNYYLYLNPDFSYVGFQQEAVVPELEKIERGQTKKLLVMLPFGHAKSDLGSKNFIPWYMGRSPHKSVILLCYGDKLVQKFGDFIRDQVVSDKFKAVFPEFKMSQGSRAKDYFKTTAGGEFIAAPFDGAVNGNRADLIVIDDPLKNMEEALSETRLEHLMDMYRGVVKNRLKPGGAILMNTTRFSLRDFVARVLEMEGDLWTTLLMSAEPDPEGHPGEYLWESHYGKERYEEAKRDPMTWAANFQQEPISGTNQRFQLDWLMGDENGVGGCIYREPIHPGDFNTYMFCDPSLGRDRTADRTCMLILAAGPEKRIFLVDAVLDRLDPGQRSEEVIRLHRIWHPKQFLYEEYGAMADTYHLKLAMEKEDLRVFPIPVGGRGSHHNMAKEDRIWQLRPDFRDGRIWLPPTMKRKLKDGSMLDIVKHFIEEEYLPYAGRGSVAHDDMLDCLARIHEDCLHMDHANPDNEYEHADGYAHNGSWETL